MSQMQAIHNAQTIPEGSISRYRREARDSGDRRIQQSLGILASASKEFNSNLGQAKEIATQFDAKEASLKSQVEAYNALVERAKSDPSNTGLQRGLPGMESNIYATKAEAEQLAQKITGIPLPETDENGFILEDNPETGERVAGTYHINDWKRDNPEHKGLDLSGKGVEDAGKRIKTLGKRASPQKGILAQDAMEDEGGSIEQAKGTKSIGSSLAAYRKSSIGA